MSREVMQQALDALYSEDVDQQSWAKTALMKALAQPAEPVAWMNTSSLITFQLDRERYPGGGGGDLSTASYAQSNYHKTPLFTHPKAAQPVQPPTDEQDRAMCEAHCNAASDEYFAARQALDFPQMRRIFYAGHRKAWIAAIKETT